MRILAIDTSVGTGSVAALDDFGHAEQPLGPPGGHARILTAKLSEVVSARGWGSVSLPLGDLGPDDVIAVVRGPGSFTGLRVGLTAAKALAWATGAKLVAVSGFETIVRSLPVGPREGGPPLAIAYDAGRGEVYAVVAAPTPSGWLIGPPQLHSVDAWLGSLPPGSLVTGPALDVLGEGLARRTDLTIAPADTRRPSAIEAARLARLRADRGAFDDPATLLPDYLRPSYAEEAKPAPLS